MYSKEYNECWAPCNMLANPNLNATLLTYVQYTCALRKSIFSKCTNGAQEVHIVIVREVHNFCWKNLTSFSSLNKARF